MDTVTMETCSWDGVRDLHITGWELGLDFNDVVKSFNVGTNTFAKKWVFDCLDEWLLSIE